MLKDTLIEDEGRLCRIELAIDLSIQEEQSETIQEYVNNEAIINEALKVSLSAASPNESIEILLEYMGKAFQCERSYIFEEKSGHLYDNTYEWCASGVVPQKENLQNMTYDVVEIWMEHFGNNENIIIKNLEDIKETDPLMYDYLLPQDIHSLVVSPLIYKNEIIGFFGVDNPPAKLLENLSTLFMILGHFIVSLIRRRNLFRDLTRLSFHDQLTGIGNRYAMNDFVEHIRRTDSIGVISCDVTGLKRINDSQGHQAGDDLLLRTRDCLKSVFDEKLVFRTGGDEFLVLCPRIAEEELAGKIQQLKAAMKEYDVVIAAGSVWRPDSTEQINHLIAEADKNMYNDKREYYAGFADRRR
jgi:diguanylate cyclase (GGDEF)-like protein